MLQAPEAPWTETETQSAKALFKKAYDREVEHLLSEVQHQAAEITQIEELWQLHDFLSAKRHEIDGKYDDRQSMIVFVFAQLIKEGLVSPDELSFLSQDKRAKIKALSRI